MKKDKRKAIDPKSGLKLIKAGYWIMIVYMVFLGLALIYEGGFLEDFWVMGLFIIIFMGFYFWTYLGIGNGYRDERLAKAAGKATTLSWYVVILSIGILVMLGGRLPEITSAQLAGSLLIIMAVSISVANEWFKRVGDSEELGG